MNRHRVTSCNIHCIDLYDEQPHAYYITLPVDSACQHTVGIPQITTSVRNQTLNKREDIPVGDFQVQHQTLENEVVNPLDSQVQS